jgi:ADYC domain-containing protein
VYLDGIQSAAMVPQDTQGTPWDDSGATFLYRLSIVHRVGDTLVKERCGPSPSGSNPNSDWAVPMSGVYEADTGALDTSDPTRFTFGCDNGVIAKCYRWGYKPWMDQANTDAAAMTHWACTRMARADYCGSGESNTLDGTHIAFWDTLAPQPTHVQPPDTKLPREMRFEAGWNGAGAVCLSHARWATMKPPPVGCPLVAPSYLVDGGTGVRCKPGQVINIEEHEQPCATVCNTPEEALLYNVTGPVRTLNHSALNGLDGGV